ncbi:hypothetical protein CIK05_04710 [Bdellovibrio sp. qaytius]|nr:hypothetical protein CIK05_04710 [Bdellovibrio sp. qaytius]
MKMIKPLLLLALTLTSLNLQARGREEYSSHKSFKESRITNRSHRSDNSRSVDELKRRLKLKNDSLI